MSHGEFSRQEAERITKLREQVNPAWIDRLNHAYKRLSGKPLDEQTLTDLHEKARPKP